MEDMLFFLKQTTKMNVWIFILILKRDFPLSRHYRENMKNMDNQWLHTSRSKFRESGERGSMKNLPWIEGAIEWGGKLEIHHRDAKKQWRAVLVFEDGSTCRHYPRERLSEALVKLDEKLQDDAGDEMMNSESAK